MVKLFKLKYRSAFAIIESMFETRYNLNILERLRSKSIKLALELKSYRVTIHATARKPSTIYLFTGFKTNFKE